MRTRCRLFRLSFAFLALLVVSEPGCHAATCTVLVVMSYSDQMLWEQEVRKGIETSLSDTCDLHFFYMNTKADLQGGPLKAKQAYALLERYRPQGIIAVDDNAQSLFVVPYLKDKVSTPVMFCGVNAKPGKYGYPASNVSGILERYHIGESLAFAKQLVPAVKTFSFIAKDSPTGKAALEQILSEVTTYPLTFAGYRMPNTLRETTAMAEELNQQSDVLFTYAMDGILDDQGKALPDSDVMPTLVQAFGKPVIGGSGYNIKYGRLCGVVKTGEEQGIMASQMLLKAMQGTPVTQIPIASNKSGTRMINVTVMTEMGIQPRPVVLRGAELLRAEK